MNSRLIAAGLTPLTLALSIQNAMAQQADSPNAEADTEVISVVGSRSLKQRSVADSPVPVDLIDASDLNAIGGTADLTDNLKALVPSYTAAPATGDGSAFVRPTSLRGTAPDQTLVLVDGKRRHRSALVQFFAPAAGNGAHGVDIGLIPAIALKRVEVLRDGAASQYGSDAIAGVINFVTKNESEGGLAQLQVGQHYEGENSIRFSANKGLALGDDGYLNLSFEYIDNEALSRGVQRPDAQALIDAGVQGVGADAPFGDEPLVQTWGRPETSASRFFMNAGTELNNGALLYARGNYANTAGRYRFFYRGPTHPTLRQFRDNFGYDGRLNDTGYTPFLDGDQTDTSLVVGVEGDTASDIRYDFSISYGQNELDYFLNNTTNPGLGLTPAGEIPQRDFDVGGYEQKEINVNADFSQAISDTFNLAYGFEWREETFTTIAGEPNSYSNADGTEGAGTSGFKGITPTNAGANSRDNYAVYVDLEQDFSEDLLMQYALRYEDFSDFGSTLNWKVAGNYSLTLDTSLRAAISTGFHAPTPGQSNIQSIITQFESGVQIEEGLIPATDPRAVSVGGQAIKEEESFNLSVGITSQVTDTTNITLDFYQIDVDDRIYRTRNIELSDGSNISFYTNVLDVEHSGLDLVVSSEYEWNNSVSTDISFAYSYNKIEVTNQREIIPGSTVVSQDTIDDIENNYPNSRFVLTTNTGLTEKLNLMVRANYYGSHYDERGVIGAAENPSIEIGSTIYVDAEMTYALDDNIDLRLGFTNLFDDYIDEALPPNASGIGAGLQYPRRTAANYEGGSWYLGVNYLFD